MSRDEVVMKLRAVGVVQSLDRSPPELVAAFVASMAESTADAQTVAAAFLEFRTDWLSTHP